LQSARPMRRVAELDPLAQTVISIRSLTDVRPAPQVFGFCRRAGAMIHPGGMMDGSRGLSEATPPDPMLKDEMHPGRGCQRAGGHLERLVAPVSGTLSGCGSNSSAIRGCCCAQPPATCWQPSGLGCARPMILPILSGGAWFWVALVLGGVIAVVVNLIRPRYETTVGRWRAFYDCLLRQLPPPD
jgi:hypothetical protein